MNDKFVDYYDVLQLSQTADAETVERVYRLLAKRYHPDNQGTGNAARFAEVHEAYTVLSDAKRRVEYDVKYDENRSMQWRIFDQTSAHDGRETDRRIFHGILSLLYVARRRDPAQGGLGTVTIEKLLGVPRQHLDFPLWYLRQHGWIETLDNGQLGITVAGVDKLADRELAVPEDRLLAASSVVGTQPAEAREGGADESRSARDDGRGAAQPPVASGFSDPSADPQPSPATHTSAGAETHHPAGNGNGDAAFPSESDLGPDSPRWSGDLDHEARQARDRAREVAARLRGSRP